MTGNGHQLLRELLGAYALDAVDDDERIAVDAHLGSCPRCRAEVVEFLEVAATLGNMGGPAPSGSWERIAAALEEPAPPLLLAPIRRGSRRRRGRAVGAAAAIAVFLVSGALVWRHVAHTQHPMLRAAQSQDLARALASPQVQAAHLRGSDGHLVAEAIVLPDGTGYLYHTDLPPLGPDRTYQLWALVDTSRLSLGVLGPDPRVVGFATRTPAWGLAITIEPAGPTAGNAEETVAVAQLLSQ